MSIKECFIVMPITTPPEMVDIYSGDKDHFKHVLDHLFVPAIEGAGLKPIPPTTKGSEVIHAEIIKNIEKADFLLCDMSALNANVFFELGIRTAVNKPVALVKDDVTVKVPFDTHLINNHTYLSSLTPWTLEAEIKKLTEHITNCCDGNNKTNSLWKYFSLSATADPLEKISDKENKIDYLTLQVAALREQLTDTKISNDLNEIRDKSFWEELCRRVRSIAAKEGVKVHSWKWGPGSLTIATNELVPKKLAAILNNVTAIHKVKLVIVHGDLPKPQSSGQLEIIG